MCYVTRESKMLCSKSCKTDLLVMLVLLIFFSFKNSGKWNVTTVTGLPSLRSAPVCNAPILQKVGYELPSGPEIYIFFSILHWLVMFATYSYWIRKKKINNRTYYSSKVTLKKKKKKKRKYAQSFFWKTECLENCALGNRLHVLTDTSVFFIQSFS